MGSSSCAGSIHSQGTQGVGGVAAHPRAQGAYCDIPITLKTHEGSSSCAGSILGVGVGVGSVVGLILVRREHTLTRDAGGGWCRGSSSCAGSIHFPTRGDTRKQSEKYSPFHCIETSTQFLGYGGHTPIRAWVLTLRPHPSIGKPFMAIPIDGLSSSASVYPLPSARGEFVMSWLEVAHYFAYLT